MPDSMMNMPAECSHHACPCSISDSLILLVPSCQANGIDAARLASYDRAIREEPNFNAEQVEGLTRDLTAYLATLKVRENASRCKRVEMTCCRRYEQECSQASLANAGIHGASLWRIPFGL